jgi:hypothetical protein
MNCDITKFLKKQLVRCGYRTIDCLFWIKIIIYESYKRCKDGRNHKENWSLSDVNVKQNNVSYDDDKVYEEVVNVGYYYGQNHYRIAQEYNSDNKQTIMEQFPLYSDEVINKYNNGGKIGKSKIMSADYGDEDVSELLKEFAGPLGNFYIDLVDKQESGDDNDDGIDTEDDGEDHIHDWVLPQMLNNKKGKKLVISDQFLNDYEFGPFDILSFNSKTKTNIYDDILNCTTETKESNTENTIDTKININLSNIDSILNSTKTGNNNSGGNSKVKSPQSPKPTKRTNIRAFNL